MDWSVLAIAWGVGVLSGFGAVMLIAWADTSPGGEV